MMDDPEDVKPEDWDNEPEMIQDADAVKPEDWDDEDDGEWEHPLIANPDFVDDETPYVQENLGGVAFELWQVTSGVVFDNIYVGDSEEDASALAKDVLAARATEEEQYNAIQAEKEAEREAAAAAEAEEGAEADENLWSDSDEEADDDEL